MHELLAVVTVLFIIAAVVFLILREFWTWYWKQSEQAELLREIRDTLRRMEVQP